MSKWSSAFRDSRWQQKRLKVMERDDWRCQSCGDKGEGITLNVHHIYYERGKAPWEYEDDILITWCNKCHSARHKMQKQLLKHLSKLTMWDLENIEPILGCRGLLMSLGDMSAGPENIKFLLDTVSELTGEAYLRGLEDEANSRGGVEG